MSSLDANKVFWSSVNLAHHLARLAGGWSGLVLMHLGRGAFGKALFADPCGALGHAAVEIYRMDVDQLMLILRLY